jgi:CRISPR-associated endonuclease Csn1
MEKFYVGVDVGTESCALAATDEHYNLLRHKGKDMWSVRLFDAAKPAVERRTKRTLRRRIARRKNRINLLQELFAQEMYRADAHFFMRLNHSALRVEDKGGSGASTLKSNEKAEQIKSGATENDAFRERTPYSSREWSHSRESVSTLFNDPNFKDKDFYLKYPTVYHLRRALMVEPIRDIRLLYLGLHHIIKYRGHFLFAGQSLSEAQNLEKLFAGLNEFFVDNDEENPLGAVNSDALRGIFMQKATLTDKKKKVCELLDARDERAREIITAFLGGKFRLHRLFGNEGYKNGEFESLTFNDANYENAAPALQQFLGNDFEFVERLKQIYDYGVLARVLKGSDCLSDAMIALYEKNKADLDKLKKFVKAHYPREYHKIFRSAKEKANYCNYIGSTKIKGEKLTVKKCGKQDFYKFIRGILTKKAEILKDDATYCAIMSDIESDDFLPIIGKTDNGIFPYQLNLTELQRILQNAGTYFDFLKSEEDGLTVANKIESLLTFRVPYYVGPLNNAHNHLHGNAWIVKKSDERIFPWNFTRVVDLESSAQKFIERMTNKCAYCLGADVLPKNSLYYTRYDVLNQLNKLRINDAAISVPLKQELYEQVFKKHTKVTDKTIRAYLISRGYFEKGDTIVLSGKDGDFKANLAPYIQLKKCLGDFLDQNMRIGEDIILWHTLFPDKEMVAKKLRDTYGGYDCIRSKITELKRLNFRDFGRLSKEFLTEVIGREDSATGERWHILDALYHTNYNLNELLFSDEFTFQDALKEINGAKDARVGYADIKESYLSPAVKRGVWQSILAVKEYVQAVKRDPDKIFIEVTRQDGEKKRTVSRRQALLDLYNRCKKDAAEINGLLDELNRKDDANLRQDRLYLYFTQLGRCMYTGEPIRLEQLDADTYDIDHILPQSIIKDDSLSNRVLVKREANAEKGDAYPVPPAWQTAHANFWKMLLDKGLISSEKYARLIRKASLTDGELQDFVARQLVFTNQSAKAVAELLHREYPKAKIVYSKAANVSDFRQRFDIVKCRDTNDLHHADDAYLNIVAGNVYDTKFSNPRDYFYHKNGEQRQYNLKKLFLENIAGAWTADHNRTLQKVKNTLAKNSKLVTRLSRVGTGSFYEEQPTSKDKALFPLRERGPYNDFEKYGGYKNLNTGYFIAVDSLDKNDKVIRTIEAVPILFAQRIENKKTNLLEVCETYLALREPKIIVDRIRIKSLLEVNGSRAYLAGKSGDKLLLHNANQWFAEQRVAKYIKLIAKLLKLFDENCLPKERESSDTIVVSSSTRSDRHDAVSKKENLELYELLMRSLTKPVFSGLSVFGVLHKKVYAPAVFDALNIIEQCRVLLQLLNLFKNNAVTSDLTLIRGAAHSGIISTNKNITNARVKLIHQSVAGLYENFVWLNKAEQV